MLSNKMRQQLFAPVIGLILVFWLAIGCDIPSAPSVAEVATAGPTFTPAAPTFTPAPLQSIATPTPLPPTSTVSTSIFTPPPLPCDTHTAAVELSASTTTLQVGEAVTISVTLRNQGCSQLGLPQYRLETTPPLFNPARPEAVIHYLGLGPGQTDTAEFGLRAGEDGQVTLTASASFEVHLGYPGPAYWAMSSTAAPLVITVSPPAQSVPEPAPAANQLDLNGAPIRAWAWSPDGQTLALAGDRSVYLYSLAAPQNPIELQVAVADGVESVAFSPDSRLLAVSITSGALQLWDVSRQALVFALDDDRRVNYFNSLAFSPDGTWLVAGGVNSRSTSSSDGIVRGINLDTWTEAAYFETIGWVGQVAFNPDGTILGLVQSTTCGRGGSWAWLVDSLTGADREPMIGGGVNLAFSPDGALLAVGVQEGAPCVPDGGFVQLWDLNRMQPVNTLTRFDDGPVVRFSPDGTLLAASDGQALRLWGLNPIQEVMRLLPRFGQIGAAAFNPDGTVVAYRDGETIQFRDLSPDLVTRPDPSAESPLVVVEDFAAYTGEQLRATYSLNAVGGDNQAAIHLIQRDGQSMLALDYTIAQPPPNDYVLAERCFSPEQDWGDARYLELWVENDDQPKTLVLQFGEGRRCAGESFSGEVWRAFVPLLSGEKRSVEVRLVDLPLARTDWSPLQNGQLDLDKIGYLAIGIHSNGPQVGAIYLGPMQLWP